MKGQRHKGSWRRFCRSTVWLLSLIVLSASCHEADMTVAVDERNPPTFNFSGSGKLIQFLVTEVPSWNQTQTVQRRSDVNTVLWQIRPTGENKIWSLPKITY